MKANSYCLPNLRAFYKIKQIKIYEASVQIGLGFVNKTNNMSESKDPKPTKGTEPLETKTLREQMRNLVVGDIRESAEVLKHIIDSGSLDKVPDDQLMELVKKTERLSRELFDLREGLGEKLM